MLRCSCTDELHHDHRTDADHLVDLFVAVEQVLQGLGFEKWSDDDVRGKMTAALKIIDEVNARGLRGRFLATGQIGITISGSGVPLDAVTPRPPLAASRDSRSSSSRSLSPMRSSSLRSSSDMSSLSG